MMNENIDTFFYPVKPPGYQKPQSANWLTQWMASQHVPELGHSQKKARQPASLPAGGQ
jgi:hypothetical protein